MTELIMTGKQEGPYKGEETKAEEDKLWHPYCCFVYIPCTTRVHIPLAHPSCSYYYLLSPSILFFAHLIVLHFLFHCTFYSYFSFFYHIYALVLCYFYIIFIFIILHCPLSGPDLIYISLLIIPCIIYYVTNKETLNLEPRTLHFGSNKCRLGEEKRIL